eukprot:tig00000361_g24396.t1
MARAREFEFMDSANAPVHAGSALDLADDHELGIGEPDTTTEVETIPVHALSGSGTPDLDSAAPSNGASSASSSASNSASGLDHDDGKDPEKPVATIQVLAMAAEPVTVKPKRINLAIAAHAARSKAKLVFARDPKKILKREYIKQRDEIKADSAEFILEKHLDREDFLTNFGDTRRILAAAAIGALMIYCIVMLNLSSGVYELNVPVDLAKPLHIWSDNCQIVLEHTVYTTAPATTLKVKVDYPPSQWPISSFPVPVRWRGPNDPDLPNTVVVKVLSFEDLASFSRMRLWAMQNNRKADDRDDGPSDFSEWICRITVSANGLFSSLRVTSEPSFGNRDVLPGTAIREQRGACDNKKSIAFRDGASLMLVGPDLHMQIECLSVPQFFLTDIGFSFISFKTTRMLEKATVELQAGRFQLWQPKPYCASVSGPPLGFSASAGGGSCLFGEAVEQRQSNLWAVGQSDCRGGAALDVKAKSGLAFVHLESELEFDSATEQAFKVVNGARQVLAAAFPCLFPPALPELLTPFPATRYLLLSALTMPSSGFVIRKDLATAAASSTGYTINGAQSLALRETFFKDGKTLNLPADYMIFVYRDVDVRERDGQWLLVSNKMFEMIRPENLVLMTAWLLAPTRKSMAVSLQMPCPLWSGPNKRAVNSAAALDNPEELFVYRNASSSILLRNEGLIAGTNDAFWSPISMSKLRRESQLFMALIVLTILLVIVMFIIIIKLAFKISTSASRNLIDDANRIIRALKTKRQPNKAQSAEESAEQQADSKKSDVREQKSSAQEDGFSPKPFMSAVWWKCHLYYTPMLWVWRFLVACDTTRLFILTDVSLMLTAYQNEAKELDRKRAKRLGDRYARQVNAFINDVEMQPVPVAPNRRGSDAMSDTEMMPLKSPDGRPDTGRDGAESTAGKSTKKPISLGSRKEKHLSMWKRIRQALYNRNMNFKVDLLSFFLHCGIIVLPTLPILVATWGYSKTAREFDFIAGTNSDPGVMLCELPLLTNAQIAMAIYFCNGITLVIYYVENLKYIDSLKKFAGISKDMRAKTPAFTIARSFSSDDLTDAKNGKGMNPFWSVVRFIITVGLLMWIFALITSIVGISVMFLWVSLGVIQKPEKVIPICIGKSIVAFIGHVVKFWGFLKTLRVQITTEVNKMRNMLNEVIVELKRIKLALQNIGAEANTRKSAAANQIQQIKERAKLLSAEAREKGKELSSAGSAAGIGGAMSFGPPAGATGGLNRGAALSLGPAAGAGGGLGALRTRQLKADSDVGAAPIASAPAHPLLVLLQKLRRSEQLGRRSGLVNGESVAHQLEKLLGVAPEWPSGGAGVGVDFDGVKQDLLDSIDVPLVAKIPPHLAAHLESIQKAVGSLIGNKKVSALNKLFASQERCPLGDIGLLYQSCVFLFLFFVFIFVGIAAFGVPGYITTAINSILAGGAALFVNKNSTGRTLSSVGDTLQNGMNHIEAVAKKLLTKYEEVFADMMAFRNSATPIGIVYAALIELGLQVEQGRSKPKPAAPEGGNGDGTATPALTDSEAPAPASKPGLTSVLSLGGAGATRAWGAALSPGSIASAGGSQKTAFKISP